MPPPAALPPLVLIDGFNFLHAVLLKGKDRAEWWSPKHLAAVVDWVVRHGGFGPAEVWVVFDRHADARGEAVDGVTGGVQVRYAPDADELIVGFCTELGGTRDIVVVSADRSLVDRARGRGARGLSPWKLAGYASVVGGAGSAEPAK